MAMRNTSVMLTDGGGEGRRKNPTVTVLKPGAATGVAAPAAPAVRTTVLNLTD